MRPAKGSAAEAKRPAGGLAAEVEPCWRCLNASLSDSKQETSSRQVVTVHSAGKEAWRL
jgi:hypothetical protein